MYCALLASTISGLDVSESAVSISSVLVGPVSEKITSYLINLPTLPYSHKCYTRADLDKEVEVAEKSIRDGDINRFAQTCRDIRSAIGLDRHGLNRHRVILDALRDHHYTRRGYVYPSLRHCLREQYVCPVMRTLHKYDKLDEATLNLSLQTLRAMDSWSKRLRG